MANNLKSEKKVETPKFANPPVIETVIGVQFNPLPDLTNAHLGAFWKKLGSDWPKATDATPLSTQNEQFSKDGLFAQAGIKLQLSQNIATRVQIQNSEGSRMVQIQNGRFHYNWLGHDDPPYPSYDVIRPEFDEIFREFQQFLREESLQDFVLNQWEITYVNHIPKNTVWAKPDDWARLFRLSPMMRENLTYAQLESFGGEWHYLIGENKGRLHIKFQHGMRSNNEIIILILTARGPIYPDEAPSVQLHCGLDLGHECIVSAFKDLTDSTAHKYWEIEK